MSEFFDDGCEIDIAAVGQISLDRASKCTLRHMDLNGITVRMVSPVENELVFFPWHSIVYLKKVEATPTETKR